MQRVRRALELGRLHERGVKGVLPRSRSSALKRYREAAETALDDHAAQPACRLSVVARSDDRWQERLARDRGCDVCRGDCRLVEYALRQWKQADRVVLARRGRKHVCGLMVLRLGGDAVEVVALCSRERGAGTQLLRLAEAWAERKGLGVRMQPVGDAHTFYERHGYGWERGSFPRTMARPRSRLSSNS